MKYYKGGDTTKGAIPVTPVIRKHVTPKPRVNSNSPHAKAQRFITEQKRMGKRPTLKQIGKVMYPKKKK